MAAEAKPRRAVTLQQLGKPFEGAAYGGTILSVLSLLVVFFGIPFYAASSVYWASELNDPIWREAPGDGGQGFQWVVWENDSAGYGQQEPYNQPAPGTVNQDCIPWNPTWWAANPSADVLTTPYWPYVYYANVSSDYGNLTHIGNPHSSHIISPPPAPSWTSAPDCQIKGDHIGLRVPSTILYPEQNVSLTHVIVDLIIPNQCWPWMENPGSAAPWTADWWFEIDGVKVLENSASSNNWWAADSDDIPVFYGNVTPSTQSLPNAEMCMGIHIDHQLTVAEELAVREVMRDKQRDWAASQEPLPPDEMLITTPLGDLVGSMNVTWHWSPKSGTDPVSYLEQRWDHSLTDTDLALRFQTKHVETHDYDLIIQGSLWLAALIIGVIAAASTPFWNPLTAWASSRKGVQF